MKFDQIAFYAKSATEVARIKALFGLTEAQWVKDKVSSKSLFPGGDWERNVAELEFNYDLKIELEIITYVEGQHWHKKNPLNRTDHQSFLSHVGLHLDDGEDFPEMPGCNLVQETFTDSHTAQFLIENGRKYHYKIFQLTPGTYIKYIKRIHAKGA